MFPATVWFWLSEGRNFNGCVNLHRHFCWIPCRPWFQHSTRWLESCCDSAWQLVRCWCSVAQCCSISHRATSAPPNGNETAALISSQSIGGVLFADYRTSRVQCNVLSFVGILVSENSLEWLHAPQSHQCEGIQHWARCADFTTNLLLSAAHPGSLLRMLPSHKGTTLTQRNALFRVFDFHRESALPIP